jgi:hypothetical protein
MTSNQTKSTPQVALLVFGKPTSADLPQASWFRAEDRSTVIAAAQSLKFSVLDIQTDGDRSLLDGVHEGVLKGTGRIIVGSVSPEVYKRIEDYAAKGTGALAVKGSNDTAARAKASTEQSTNNGAEGAATSSTAKVRPTAPEKLTPVPDAWAALRVGSHVVAKHWYDGEANGWWIAVITAVEGDDFVIRWLDEPSTPPLKIERKHVALPHPDFDVAREWDRKPPRRAKPFS